MEKRRGERDGGDADVPEDVNGLIPGELPVDASDQDLLTRTEDAAGALAMLLNRQPDGVLDDALPIDPAELESIHQKPFEPSDTLPGAPMLLFEEKGPEPPQRSRRGLYLTLAGIATAAIIGGFAAFHRQRLDLGTAFNEQYGLIATEQRRETTQASARKRAAAGQETPAGPQTPTPAERYKERRLVNPLPQRKNPRLERLLGFKRGIDEETARKGLRYSRKEDPAYYDAIVGLAEDRTNEKELRYTITKATDTDAEVYVIKLLDPATFGDRKLSFLLRAPGVKNLARIDLSKRNADGTLEGRFSADLPGALGLDGKTLYVVLGEVVYGAHNEKTGKDLIGYEAFATDTTTVDEALSGHYAAGTGKGTGKGRSSLADLIENRNGSASGLEQMALDASAPFPPTGDPTADGPQPSAHYRPNSFYAHLRRHGYDDRQIAVVGKNIAHEYATSEKSIKVLAAGYDISASTYSRLARKELASRGIRVTSRKEARALKGNAQTAAV